ncbi:putative homeobox domain-containing protein [Erysiphe neolycopersici]|uniref:Putative homeobox domain-containing protein n=1 Tax=Erysiphe neolycopersici TaxID=212602 RepID=A0A420I3S4_9PEZI|nr:putative homeobox domain-containing protein [Erysiphe neolycopersici]
MLPSLSTFTKFEVTHRATRSPPPPPPPAPFRTTCASSEHNEQLPSIFELIPELSEGSPRDYHLLPSWHESEPRYYGPRNYYPPPPPPPTTTTNTTTMNTTSTAFNPSSTYSSSKRRRLSIDDGEEEEIRKSREIMDMRSRDALSSPGQWSYFQRTNAPTPDPSSSSRRSSTFSSTETWNGGSPRSNRYTNDSSSPFSRTYAVTPRVITQFSNEGPAQKIPLRENSHYPPDLGHDMYAENLCHYNNDDGVAAREGETKPRKRRGNLPKDTTEKLRTWFLNHLEHPYPTEDEKQQLMDSTGLQMNQISNWYINARRRQLPAITANARAEAEARRHMQNSKKCEEV